MASKIKQKIAKNFYEAVHNKFYNGRYDEFFGCFNLLRHTDKTVWRVNFPIQPDVSPTDEFFKDSQKELIEDGTIKNFTYLNNYNAKLVDLELNVKDFVKDVLDSNPIMLNYKPLPQKVIVEFSSPNIAKPFHVGHLRSTIIGNCLANVKKKLGNHVIKMNYLGDWGTQMGMIQVGMNLENYSEETLKTNPIKTLYKAYVRGNREAELNLEIYEQVKQVFAELELGNEELTQKWKRYQNWTMDELSNVYSRLGVSFDEYSWESDYKRKNADKVLKMLEEAGIMSVDEVGRKIATVGESKMPLIKSDDTTLYLLRDLMAVVYRRAKYDFDEMYYVVENGQNVHFNSLFTLCKEIKINEGKKLEHVKFGRIHGMSTRHGKVVFLNDILEEAKERSYQNQVNAKTTKASLDNKDIADILGVSAVIVNDLKQHRLRDYEFSWEKILHLKGETGIPLQYCYCRLCSLEANCGFSPASDCDPEALSEPEAVNLAIEIARFEEALWHTNYNLEPCILVRYLFQLIRSINKAFKVLNIKDSGEHVGSQRLLLFNKSREVLGDGMKLLGLRLLTQM